MHVSRNDRELIEVFLAPLATDLVQTLADERISAALREQAAAFIHPDAEIVFRAGAGVVLGPLRGADGLFEGWQEWLSTFGSYRIEVDDVLEEPDRTIVLVRQVGRTRHGVEVPSSPSAAIVTVREGRIARIAFYLDRVAAAEAEGFELP